MQTIEDFIRSVFSYTLTEQKFYKGTEKVLRENLKRYIRPELFGPSTKDVRLDNLLSSAAKFLGNVDDEEKRIFLEDSVGKYVRESKAEELRAILETKLERRYNIPEDLAEKFISTSDPLSVEEQQKFQKVRSDIVKLIAGHLSSYLKFDALEWGRKKERKERDVGKFVKEEGEEILTDNELIEEGERPEWQEGLTKKLFGLINRQILEKKPYTKEKRQYAYKVLLLDRFMAKNKTKFTDIAKKTGVPAPTLTDWEKDLKKMLALFLNNLGLGPKFVDEEGLTKYQVKVPDNFSGLDSKENKEDFKDYIKEKIKDIEEGGKKEKLPEGTEEILNMMVDGHKNKSIISKGFSQTTVENIRKRKFKKWYDEWYQDMVKDIREASERIIKALMIINAEALPSSSHENAVDKAIEKRYPLELTVSFGANYDLQDTIKEDSKVDPEKDEVDFRYKHYQVKLDRTAKPRIIYTYDQDLSNDGKFIGTPKSELTIEGNPGNELLRKKLDDYVEKEMKIEGVLPYGPSVKSRHAVRIPVRYVNYKLDKSKTYDGVGKREYHGFIDFADKYRGLMIEDEPHLKRVEEEGKRERKRMIPKGGKNQINKLISQLNENIDDEKSEKSPDTRKINEWKNQIKELKEHLKKDDDEKLNKFLDRNKERFKFAVSEERLKKVRELMKLQDLVKNKKEILLSRRMKSSPKDENVIKLQEEIKGLEKQVEDLEKSLEQTKETFPPPLSPKVTKLFSVFADLDIKDKIIYGFLSSGDVMYLVQQVQGALAKEAEQNTAGVRKNKNMSEEEKAEAYKRINKKREHQLWDFVELFKALPGDMKKRLEIFKKKDPTGYKKLEEKHGAKINWVDKPEETLTKVQKNLFIPKALVTPTHKQKSVVPMEEADAKFMLNWLEAQLRGFSVIGERFGNASMEPGGLKPEEKEKITDNLNKAEKAFGELRKKISEMEEKKGSNSKEINDLKATIPEYIRNINTLKSILFESKGIPALIFADVLRDRTFDFTKMYNPLTKTLWFKPQSYAKRAEVEDTEGSTKLTTLQKNIAKNAVSLSKQNIFDVESVQALTKAIQSGLTKFKKDFTKMASIPYSVSIINRSFPYMTVAEKLAVEKVAADQRDLQRVKFVFLEGELAKAKEMIKKLKEKDLDDASASAARELDKIVETHTKAYNDVNRDKIKAKAEKEGISMDEAETRLKRIRDSLSKSAVSKFILKWQDVMDMGLKQSPKERGPLGGPPSSKFDKILEMIEDDVPELFQITPPEEEQKEVIMGIPTPKEIRELIEEQFDEKGFPQTVEREYAGLMDKGKKVFKDTSGAKPEGGGGSGGGRQKPIKKHPPSHTYETLKSNFIEALKTKSVHNIVLGEIGRYLHDIQNYVKGGTYFDVDDIVAGVVDILKNFKKVIKSLRVSTQPGGSVDIKIKDKADGVKLFNKLSDIYKLIDMIASDESGKPVIKIGPIQGDLSKIKTQRGEPDTWFPKGLMNVYDSTSREEIEKGSKKKAPKEAFSGHSKRLSAEFMAFRLAHKFSSDDLKKIEGVEIGR